MPTKDNFERSFSSLKGSTLTVDATLRARIQGLLPTSNVDDTITITADINERNLNIQIQATY